MRICAWGRRTSQGAPRQEPGALSVSTLDQPVPAGVSEGDQDPRGPEPVRVLFVQHCSNHTGSAISGRLLAEGFRNAGWDVDVAFGFEGPMIAQYAALGCRTHVVPHKSWLR